MEKTKLVGIKHNQSKLNKSEEVQENSNYLRNGITYALKIDYALEWADSKTGYSGGFLKKNN